MPTSPDEVAWLNQWLPAIRATERHVMDSVCTYEQHEDFDLFKSLRFPNFYSGNGIRVHPSAAVCPIERWVQHFQKHFSPLQYRHVTILLSGDAWLSNSEAEAEATALGLRVYKETFMAVRSETLARNALTSASQTPVLLLSTEDAAAGLYQLHLDESRDEDWFEDEDDFRKLFDKTLAIAHGTGTRWFVVPSPESAGRYIASIGFFHFEGVCRLQEVITAAGFRRRGLASALVGAVSAHATATGMQVTALLADPDSEAHRLYGGLGFADLAFDVTLMRY